MTGFYMKCNTGLEWVKGFEAINHVKSTFVEERRNFPCPTQVHFLDDVKSFIGALDEASNLLEANRVYLYDLAAKLVAPSDILKKI